MSPDLGPGQTPTTAINNRARCLGVAIVCHKMNVASTETLRIARYVGTVIQCTHEISAQHVLSMLEPEAEGNTYIQAR